MSFEAIVDDGHPMITIAHHEQTSCWQKYTAPKKLGAFTFNLLRGILKLEMCP